MTSHITGGKIKKKIKIPYLLYLKILRSFLFNNATLLQLLACVQFPRLLGLKENIFRNESLQYQIQIVHRNQFIPQHITDVHLLKRCQLDFVLQCSSAFDVELFVSCIAKSIPAKSRKIFNNNTTFNRRKRHRKGSVLRSVLFWNLILNLQCIFSPIIFFFFIQHKHNWVLTP